MSDPIVFETPYLPNVESSQMPAWLDHVARFHGLRPPRTNPGSYRYVDLGCGYGLTLLHLAAAHPAAAFVGVDGNPGHIEAARQIAARAGLTNVDFRCALFGAPELDGIEPADYVVANGVYTWLPEAARGLLVRHFGDLLKPGGLAEVGYNLMRGWLALLPVQRIIAQVHRDAGEGDTAEIFGQSRDLIAAIADSTNASLFRHGAEMFKERVWDTDDRYKVHEYLAPGWNPVWTGELAAAMETAECRYVGELDLMHLRDDHALNSRQRALLAEAQSPEMEWLLRDLFWPRPYARGLFRKSCADPAAETPTRFAGWLRLTRPAGDVAYECRTSAGKLTFDSRLARDIVDRLASGPRDLATLAEEDADDAFATIDALCASGQAAPCDPPQPDNGVERLNRAIAEMGIEVRALADVHATPRPAPRED